MPRKRGITGRKMKFKEKMTLSEVRKRLMELNIMYQDYIRRKKSIDHNDAIMYIEQMNAYKEQFYNNDEILQVIRRLTMCFEAIITAVYSQIENIPINTKRNDMVDAFGHLENMLSPVYSENEEDEIQTFRVLNNISSPDNKKTKKARDICEHNESSNKKTDNLNTIGGNSKDYGINDEYSESILSNYHPNVYITHTVNDKSNKIKINKPLHDNNIKETKTTISLAAKDHTLFKKQKILSHALFGDDDDDDDVVFNQNTVARTTNSEIRNFTIKRPSQNTSVKNIRKPKKIFEERFTNETDLYSHDIFSEPNFDLINVKKAVEATVNNNKSQAAVTRTNENKNDKGNNILNCKSTETLCVQRKNDNKSGKNILTVDTPIQKNRFIINGVTIIRKPVLEHKNTTLFNENLLSQYKNVDTYSLDHTFGTFNTENINGILENKETKVNENFVIPKPANMNKKPKGSRKKPMKANKKDKNLTLNRITKINNKKDKTNKKRNFELSENSIATSVNTEQKSNTNCDTSITNSYISEAEFYDNRSTKNNEIMNEVDLSWIEKIESVRIIDEDEYDPRLDNLSDSFWTDFTLPTDCSVSELFD